MLIPCPRGVLSAQLFDLLHHPPSTVPATLISLANSPELTDEDLHIALFTCYELHYLGVEGVDDYWQWNSSLLSLRAVLEARFLRLLEDLAGEHSTPHPDDVAKDLFAETASPAGLSLSRFLEQDASIEQFREFVIHRSVYNLKEADPHTRAIPQLQGKPKAALIEIQIDEYGYGDIRRMHSELFRTTMRELDLNDSYNYYIDIVPGWSLAQVNAMSYFSSHRRWRAATLGNLAALEMTSSVPNRRFSQGLRRLGVGARGARFYDEHVEADAVHEQVAGHDMCRTFAQAYPEETGHIMFGARAYLAVDALASSRILSAWCRDETSLLKAVS